MKVVTKTVLSLLALGASAAFIIAQDNGGGSDPGGQPGNHAPGAVPRPHRVPPIIAALDANHDGVIDETEIANASAALKTLDKNGDGKLTMDELMGPRPPRGGGPNAHQGPPPGADGELPPPPPPGDR